MKTTVVSDNLLMLTRRNLVLPNAYLVREDDGFTLIDTTTRGAADKLVARRPAPAPRSAGWRSLTATETMSARWTR